MLAATASLLALPGLGSADVPRALALRGAAAVLTALFVSLPGLRRPRTAGGVLIPATLALVVLSHAASVTNAIDPAAALWGTPGGRLGVATAVAGAVVALATAVVPRLALRVCAASCSVAATASWLAPGMFGGAEAVSWIGLCGAGLAIWIAVTERRSLWAAAAVACAGTALARGGPTALLGAWLGVVIALSVGRDEFALGRRAKRLVTAAFVLTLIVPPAAVVIQETTSLSASSPSRALVDVVRTEPAVFERGARLAAAVDAGRSRPLLGAGGGGFRYAWDYFFPPRILDVAPSAMDVESADNVLLNAFAERGVPGALAELLLLVAAFVTVTLRRRRGEIDAAAATVLASLIVARAGNGLLAGSDVSGAATFAVVLGLCIGHGRPDATAAAPRTRRAPRVRLAIGLAVAAALVIPPGITAALAGSRRVPLSPLASHVRAAAAESVPDQLRSSADAHLIDPARDALTARLDEQERDVRAARALGRLAVAAHLRCARDDLLAPALARLDDTLGWAPTRADLGVVRCDLLRALARDAEALEQAEDAWSLSPNWPETVWRYAEILAATGAGDEARDLVREALLNGLPFEGRGRDIVRALSR